MKKAYIILVLLLVSGICYSQGGWYANIASIFPVPNSTGNSASSTIEIVFSQDMDSTSFFNNVTIHGSQRGTVSFSLGYFSSQRKLSLFPDGQFFSGEIVTVLIENGVKYANGNNFSSPVQWTYSIGSANGTCSFSKISDFGCIAKQMLAKDFNADGNPDIGCVQGSAFYLFQNDGFGNFSFLSNTNLNITPQNEYYGPTLISAADVDKDGDLDLVVPDPAPGSSFIGHINIFKNNGSGAFTLTSVANVGRSPWATTAADFDNDGDIEIASVNDLTQNLSVLDNNGAGVFTQINSYPIGNRPRCLTNGDINNDGFIDIIVSNNGTYSLMFFVNDGDGTFSLNTPVTTDEDPKQPQLVDIDNDHDWDVLLNHGYELNFRIYKNNGSANFSLNQAITGMGIADYATGDFNSDGYTDFMVTCSNQFALWPYLNNGAGNYYLGNGIPVPYEPDHIISGDWNNDGSMDIAFSAAGMVEIYSNEPYLPVIRLLPISQNICEGGNLSLVAQTTSLTPVTYKWLKNGDTIQGVVDSVLNLNSLTLSDSGTYVCIAENIHGSSQSNPAYVKVNQRPQVFVVQDTVIQLGASISLNSVVGGGTPPFIYIWVPSAGLNNAQIPNPIATPSMSIVYNLTVTDSNGCQGSDQVTIEVATFRISGTVIYDNAEETPLQNVCIMLKDSNGAKVDSAYSDADGNFGFNNVNDGIYTIELATDIPWFGGNAADALLMLKHYLNMIYLSGLRLLAAKIDGDNFVTSGDALLDLKRYLNMVTSFPVGDWIFEQPSIHLTPGNNSNLIVRGLCFGDVDGSYIPTTIPK